MTDPFVAEVRIFGFNFPPRGWAFCNGALVSIPQNTALFSLLGTNYGGDGKTTFGLPDLTGTAVPIGSGQGPGLSDRVVGETGGSPTVTLLNSEVPPHGHQMLATSSPADVSSPTPQTALARSTGRPAYGPAANLQELNVMAVSPSPGDQPHNNLMPYQVLNYCIAMQGVFPARP